MTLHLVNKAPARSSALSECLELLAHSAETSALLLIEDAVYAAVDDAKLVSAITQLDIPCYVLQEDLQARGLSDRVAENFRVIDYSGFVRLSLDHAKVQSWS